MEKYTSLEHTIKKVVAEQNYRNEPIEEAVGAIGTDKPHEVPRAFFKSVHINPRKGEAQIPATGTTRAGRNYELEKAGVHKEEIIDESKAALAQKLFTPRGGAAVPKPSTPPAPAPKPPGEVVPFPKQTPEPATPPVKPAEPTPVAPPAPKPGTTPAPDVAPVPAGAKTPSTAPAPVTTPGQGKAPSATPAPSPKPSQTPKPMPPIIPGLGGGLGPSEPNQTTDKRVPVTSRFAVPHKRRKAHFEETRYDIKNVARPEDKREDSIVGRPNEGKSKYTKQAEIIRKVVEEKKIVINKKNEENQGKNPLVDTEPTLKYNPLDQGSKDVR